MGVKNKHLEHLEDDILNNGSQGGKTSIAFLRSLGSMLSQGDKKSIKAVSYTHLTLPTILLV